MDTNLLRAAIVRLHAEKAAAYGDAWKRRGEVMSIMANLARKVDRLTIGGHTRDENLLDTAIDLLVYALKYQTYLADLDTGLAHRLLGPHLSPPHSDGVTGFEHLFADLPSGLLAGEVGRSISKAIDAVHVAFGRLERQFSLSHTHSNPAVRAVDAADLAHAAAILVGALVLADPAQTQAFITTWTEHR